MADLILLMPVANRYDKVSIRIPNGLLAIAAGPVASGYSTKIIDLKIDPEWEASLRSSIGKETLCVGISCSTGRMIKSALEIASKVREINPDLPIVWGGPHPTLLPEQTLQHDLVDIVVINEGDLILLNLIDALASKKDLSTVKGIAFKSGKTLKINPKSELVKDLDSLKTLPYHLLEVEKYSSLVVHDLPSIDLVTSRGCPFSCGFCSTPITSERRWRSHSVEHVMENISLLYQKYGVRTFYFSDDNFMVDLNRVERFVDALKNSGMKIFWGAQGVRVDTINAMSVSLLEKVEASGCSELSIGIESANPEILKTINKQISIDDILRANGKLAGRSFAVKYNFIIGFPGETLAEIKQTVNLAIRLNKKNKMAWFPFNIFTPFPGTPMFEKAMEYGFKGPDHLETWEKLESIGWDRDFNHWMNKEETTLLRSINCTSYLAFPAAIQKISNPILRGLFHLYRPFAFFRFKKMAYFFHLEKKILEFMDSTS